MCFKEEASVVMKDDKKTKIKTFSTAYARSDSAFFSSVLKQFFADSALQSLPGS